MKDTEYFYKRVPQLLEKLTESAQPAFGLMTPQHMIEHLIWVTKATLKDGGTPPEELSKSQQGFMRFIEKGANFQYRPSDKTIDDLVPLRFESLDAAKAELPKAIERLKAALDGMKEEDKFYNQMMGVIPRDGMELMHRKHYEWHLEKQYNLS